MGLFGSNYERAGSGIAKNAPKKKGFFRFFEIFGRKFWKLFELNLLYFLSFLPVIGAVVLALALDSQLGIILAAACLVLFAVIIGPATAAHTKILKNFVMEKPTFLVHDFFKAFRSEFKYSCIIGVLDCLLACCISAAFYVYPKLIEQSGSKVYYIFFAITLSIGVIALIMNFYIFPMLVSTNLSLSVVALKTNIITTLILAAVIAVYVLVFMFVNIKYSMILLFLLPFMPASWLGLVITFQSYPIIQKYIINPYYEQRGEVNPELAQVSASEEETVFEDMGGKEKPIEPPKKAGGKQSGGGRTHKGKGKIIS